jgi:hypothetical protein
MARRPPPGGWRSLRPTSQRLRLGLAARASVGPRSRITFRTPRGTAGGRVTSSRSGLASAVRRRPPAGGADQLAASAFSAGSSVKAASSWAAAAEQAGRCRQRKQRDDGRSPSRSRGSLRRSARRIPIEPSSSTCRAMVSLVRS